MHPVHLAGDTWVRASLGARHRRSHRRAVRFPQKARQLFVTHAPCLQNASHACSSLQIPSAEQNGALLGSVMARQGIPTQLCLSRDKVTPVLFNVHETRLLCAEAEQH